MALLIWLFLLPVLTDARAADNVPRRLQDQGQGEPNCDSNAAFAALSARVLESCCPQQEGEEQTSDCKLPTSCHTTECADEFLPFFDACYAKLTALDERIAEFQAFNANCEAFVGGAGMEDASVIARGDTTLLCFPVSCRAPSVGRGVVFEEGCAADGTFGDTCRLGCAAGYDASGAVEGTCVARWLEHEEVAIAEYVNQQVTCVPARNQDGSMSEEYCRMEQEEAVLDCCQEELTEAQQLEQQERQDLFNTPVGVPTPTQGNPGCGTSRPPETCSISCAERWLPLLEDCEEHLTEFQALTEACNAKADEFVGKAPSTVTVGGLVVHPNANGLYSIALHHTIGGKAHWIKEGSDGQAFHLYAINEPHDGYAIGENPHTNFVLVETYEDHPPWGEHGGWNEITDSHGAMSPVRLLLSPGFSDHDCGEALRLNGPELTERCFAGKRGADGSFRTQQSFEQSIAAGGGGPEICGYDCTEIWYEYSEDCSDFLVRNYAGLAGFTARCGVTHESALIYNVDGTLESNGHDNHFFTADQGVVYDVLMVPGGNLLRTELALEAEGTHHPMAERVDVTQQGAGAHSFEWDAPEHLAGLNIKVEALEGRGDYHLSARIVGTTERISREVILNRPVLFQTECRFFDDCTFRCELLLSLPFAAFLCRLRGCLHFSCVDEASVAITDDGLEMRGDGSSFPLRSMLTAGFTYNFTATLRDNTDATHLRIAVYPPDSISTTDDAGSSGAGCNLPSEFSEPAHDVGEIALGAFAGPSGGRRSWGDAKCGTGSEPGCCADPTRVGPREAPCDGNYRHFPDQDFGSSGSWVWTCPFTAEYILLVTTNCECRACEASPVASCR